MCGGKKEGQVTAVESVNADGSGKDGDKKTPPMTPKDKEQVSVIKNPLCLAEIVWTKLIFIIRFSDGKI